MFEWSWGEAVSKQRAGEQLCASHHLGEMSRNSFFPWFREHYVFGKRTLAHTINTHTHTPILAHSLLLQHGITHNMHAFTHLRAMQGPEIRTGTLKDGKPIQLVTGQVGVGMRAWFCGCA